MESDLNKPVMLDDLVLSNPKKYLEYAKKYSCDELLDLLNQCREDPERRKSIIEILTIQANDIDLKALLDMFYADDSEHSYRNIFMNGPMEPELTFKYSLLRDLTLLINGLKISDREVEFLNSFKIDLSNITQLYKIKVELEQNLEAVYNVTNNNFYDISGDKDS